MMDYITYCLYDKLQNYNGKMVARTCKYAKRLETVMKAYKFDVEDPITVLRFLAQFENLLFKQSV